MDTRSEIKNDIDQTRDKISNRVDEISRTLHNRMDWKGRVTEDPVRFLLIALAAGFVISSLSNPIGRGLLRFGARSAMAALGAYISKKGIDIMKDRVFSGK